jgi:hypothetical protein
VNNANFAVQPMGAQGIPGAQQQQFIAAPNNGVMMQPQQGAGVGGGGAGPIGAGPMGVGTPLDQVNM